MKWNIKTPTLLKLEAKGQKSTVTNVKAMLVFNNFQYDTRDALPNLISYSIYNWLRNTRVVPKVMSNNFFHANWEQQTKESKVVDEISCCVILECLVTSIACITWPVSLLTKWSTTICRFARVLSSNFLWKRKSLLQKFTRDFSVLMELCAWVRAVFEDWWNILKMGTRASKMSLGAALSCEGDGHSLLGCRGVDFGWIPGMWAKHHCCSLCQDTAQAPPCIAR